MDRGFTTHEGQGTVNLTNDEMAYLKSLEPVIVCPDPDWPPFEFKDEKQQFAGIAADLLSLIFRRLSLQYRCLWTENWEESLTLSQEGKVHIIPFLNRTPERETWLSFTDPIFVDPNVFVSRLNHPYIEDTNQLDREVLALPQGTAVEKYIKEFIPNLQIVNRESELEIFQMVSQGDADVTLRSLMVSAYTIGIHNLQDLKIAGLMPDITNYLRMGVIHRESQLCPILNKAIKTITPQDQVRIVDHHINSKLASARHSNAHMMLSVTLTTSANWYWNYRLQRYNEGHSILLDHMCTQVWYLSDSCTYGRVNKAHASFLGIRKEQLEQRKIREVLPKGIAEEQISQNKKVFAEGNVLESEEWFLNDQGEKRLLQISRVPRMGPDGNVDFVVCSAVDITERRHMEQELFIEKELFRTTLLSVSDGVISTDTEGRIVVLNEAASSFTGWSQEDALGQCLYEVLTLVHEDSLEPYTVSLSEVDEAGTIILDQNLALIHRDGTSMAIEGSLAAVREDSGLFSGVAVVFRDVTEKRENQRKTEFFSLRDPLTGLFNRRFFEEELARLDVPHSIPFSLLLADVNGLKLTNDAFGHEAGDQMLQGVARLLEEVCRRGDTIARIGGDEFVVLLPQTTQYEAVKLQKRITAAMDKTQEESMFVSVSCGVGTKKSTEEAMTDIIKSAEKLMYREKIAERQKHRFQVLQNIQKKLFTLFPRERCHSQNVAALAQAIAQALNLEEEELKRASLTGQFHDLGKVAIHPDSLRKGTSLSLSERNEYWRHSEVGFNILINIEEYASIAAGVLAHHEHWDGSGFPKGIKGLEIPLHARIVCLANAYDSMTGEWLKEDTLSNREAIATIVQESGSKFDPQIVQAFVKTMNR